MNLKSLKSLALASSLVLPFVAADTLAYGMSPGKSCGYKGWHHPHGYSMGHWHPGHGYGRGYRYGMGKGMYRHGYGHHGRTTYGTDKYGYHPMMRTGGYGQWSGGGSGMGKTDDVATAGKDIVDTAASAGNFTTLIEAVKAAGLVDTLRGDGPYTVFAPTDEAFAKIPSDTLDALLQDKDQLTAVLTYHVAPGSLRAADVINRDSIETVQGQSLTITADDAGVSVDKAKVTKTDIIASNGVIHVIDTVVLPN